MINSRRSFYISAVIACLIFAGLQFSSTAWFREKLAGCYEARQEYTKAIQLYNRILVKDGVKRRIDGEDLARIYLSMGSLYAGLDLRNLAIESYTKAVLSSPEITQYPKSADPAGNKLLVIGMLEAEGLKKADAEESSTDELFLIGDTYIENGLFGEARAFFTKRILDYGAGPVDVLAYLHRRYGRDKRIRERVWGKDIYVALEDFERIEPGLGMWDDNSGFDDHRITKEIAYKGRYSEFLAITSFGQNRDWWAKSVKIPLDDKDLELGIRFFIKSPRPDMNKLHFNTVYPEQKETGLYSGSIRRDIGEGWEEYRIDDISMIAGSIAQDYNWDPKGMYVDKIVVDTRGHSNRFYVDSIELYVVN